MLKNNTLNLVKKALEKRKKALSFDTLGRSLSSNPFMPKDIYSHLQDSNSTEILILENINLNNTFLNDIQTLNPALYLIKTNIEANLDEISYIRRYTEIPLIRDDFFIDKYQILESLVYGADGIKLSANMLDLENLRQFSLYAFHLGMQSVIEVFSKDELMNAILATTNIISINNKNQDEVNQMLKSIPSNKIIFINENININNNKNQKIFIKKAYNG